GSSRRGLGYPQEAVALLEKAHQTFQDVLGADHADSLQCAHTLARAYDAVGQSKRSAALYEQILAKRKETLGPDHEDTLHTMNNLGNAYWPASSTGPSRSWRKRWPAASAYSAQTIPTRSRV